MSAWTVSKLSPLFFTLLDDIEAEQWDERDMRALSMVELRHIAFFMGKNKGFSCPKEELIARVAGVRQIWLKLKPLCPSVTREKLADAFTAKILKGFMRELGWPRCRSKAELVEFLFMWWCACSHIYPSRFPSPSIITPEWRRRYLQHLKP